MADAAEDCLSMRARSDISLSSVGIDWNTYFQFAVAALKLVKIAPWALFICF